MLFARASLAARACSLRLPVVRFALFLRPLGGCGRGPRVPRPPLPARCPVGKVRAPSGAAPSARPPPRGAYSEKKRKEPAQQTSGGVEFTVRQTASKGLRPFWHEPCKASFLPVGPHLDLPDAAHLAGPAAQKGRHLKKCMAGAQKREQQSRRLRSAERPQSERPDEIRARMRARGKGKSPATLGRCNFKPLGL